MDRTNLRASGTFAPIVSVLGPDCKLFEVCWEVAKAVGGIYTVLKSKAAITTQEISYEDYCVLAPNVESTSGNLEFELDLEPPKDINLLKTLQVLSDKHGIRSRYGRWLVKGYPRVVLLDINSSRGNLERWGKEMAPWYNTNDPEVNDAVIFGFQSAILLQEYERLSALDGNVTLAHFHEWMAGIASILLKRWGCSVGTVFTTHATTLGRWLSAGKVDFYNIIERIDGEAEAGKRMIYQKHWIEKEAWHSSYIATTVSEITGFETEFLLKRKADVLLPNGLQLERFAALHEFQNLHANFKDVIHEFVRGHFHPYDWDLDNTLYFVLSGRYEFFNKGMDVYIDALAKLNWMLKQSKSPVNVVAFIITAAPNNGFNVESLRAQTMMKDVAKTCSQIVSKMNSKLLESTSKGQLIDTQQLLDDHDIVRLKNRIHSLKQRSTLPPVVTHNMKNDDDEVLKAFRQCGLVNGKDDRVKVVFHPEFLNSLNPLIPLDYTDFVRGCHLGVFPSYYEPWGYTPAECSVLGVPSITSNLSGFGNFITKNVENPDHHGIYIIDRRYSHVSASEQTANYMWKFINLNRRERIELRNRTERLSELFSWNKVHTYYNEARLMAKERVLNAKKYAREQSKSNVYQQQQNITPNIPQQTQTQPQTQTQSQISNNSNASTQNQNMSQPPQTQNQTQTQYVPLTAENANQILQQFIKGQPTKQSQSQVSSFNKK